MLENKKADIASKENLIACPYCDSVYYRPHKINKKYSLYCHCCGGHLIDGNTDFFSAFIFALTALILFVIANLCPFITLVLQGEINTISVFSSVKSLFDNNLWLLAIMVFLFVIILPLYYLCAVLWVIISFRYKLFNKVSRRFLFLLYKISPWNMLEVYLAGVIVTLVKIMTMAAVKFEQGFWAFVVLMFFSILTDSRFDVRDAIFEINEEEK